MGWFCDDLMMMIINVVSLIFLRLYDAGAFTVYKFLQSKQHQQEIDFVYVLNECKSYLTSCSFIKVFLDVWCCVWMCDVPNTELWHSVAQYLCKKIFFNAFFYDLDWLNVTLIIQHVITLNKLLNV